MSIPERGVLADIRAYSLLIRGVGVGSFKGGREGCVDSWDGGSSSSASMRAWAAARAEGVGSGSMSMWKRVSWVGDGVEGHDGDEENGGGREGIWETYKGGSRERWLLEAWLCQVDVRNGD